MLEAHPEDDRRQHCTEPLPDPGLRARQLGDLETWLMARITFHRRQYNWRLHPWTQTGVSPEDLGDDLEYHTQRQVELAGTLAAVRRALRRYA